MTGLAWSFLGFLVHCLLLPQKWEWGDHDQVPRRFLQFFEKNCKFFAFSETRKKVLSQTCRRRSAYGKTFFAAAKIWPSKACTREFDPIIGVGRIFLFEEFLQEGIFFMMMKISSWRKIHHDDENFIMKKNSSWWWKFFMMKILSSWFSWWKFYHHKIFSSWWNFSHHDFFLQKRKIRPILSYSKDFRAPVKNFRLSCEFGPQKVAKFSQLLGRPQSAKIQILAHTRFSLKKNELLKFQKRDNNLKIFGDRPCLVIFRSKFLRFQKFDQATTISSPCVGKMTILIIFP